MNIEDKIKIINQRIAIWDLSIPTIQNNIVTNGEPKPGTTFEQIMSDMVAKRQALISLKQELLSDIIYEEEK